ncbi:HipA family kinase [Xenorhabdus griffiniae]|uniref:HipA-like kinase domain-containing protein n=1 Tax=Xenorhabdus griffiniae TaxID=351672 RepID=A0ABY9XGZ5_9GAMM|nr:HipA family kinase [Xenorhabdus griffiniae]MBD1226703.1 hypothetical protein [Xenorhabdus griffiniae]MBE8586886.1 hypothetical protein [Xenorhabdus griffiniae]WMV72211.1 hypothetical protein QL128_19290 [Xenorhabdus griffiniae]WNH01889.1 hypothetical protein QL112_019300 [Xenorhabdus griffiniae]
MSTCKIDVSNRGYRTAMLSDVINVVEIIRKMSDGSTEPYLCKCDDGGLYVVKSQPKMPKLQLIHELIASYLAKSINLPLPDIKVVYISRELLAFMPCLTGELSEGHAFVTKYIPDSACITYHQAHTKIEKSYQKLIYFFDRLINNSDRNLTAKGGNVNIIYNYKTNRYYLIDHNLAFMSPCESNEFDYHVFSPINRDWDFDRVDKYELDDVVENILYSFSYSIIKIPSE